MLLWLIASWLGLNAAVAAFAVLAARMRRAGDGPTRRELAVRGALMSVLGASVIVLVSTSSTKHWEPASLVGLLATLALVSDVLPVQSSIFRISSSFLAIMLAAAILGPAPAAAIGVAGTLIDAARRRPPRLNFLANLAAYATYPLAGGLLLQGLHGQVGDEGYALAVLPVALAANLVNFLMVAAPICVVRRRRLRGMVRSAWLPLLPWQLATALVLATIVLAVEHFGVGIVGIVAFALIVFQLLLKAVVEREEQSEELTMRLEQLGARHEGMLALVLHAQGLRDPTAVRHAAAVAHHARELAAAAGLSEHDQAVVHTAGLLHDIGKAALPDAVLVAERELRGGERLIVERHTIEGARLVRKVPGLGQVAEVIESHHERPDGRGYPARLEGDEIPLLARVLAVAEVWDALTAPDSYRGRLDNRSAAGELRRAAGTQLDARLVDLLLGEVVATGRFARDQVDVERELRLERDAHQLLDAPI